MSDYTENAVNGKHGVLLILKPSLSVERVRKIRIRMRVYGNRVVLLALGGGKRGVSGGGVY